MQFVMILEKFIFYLFQSIHGILELYALGINPIT